MKKMAMKTNYFHKFQKILYNSIDFFSTEVMYKISLISF